MRDFCQDLENNNRLLESDVLRDLILERFPYDPRIVIAANQEIQRVLVDYFVQCSYTNGQTIRHPLEFKARLTDYSRGDKDKRDIVN